MTEFFFLLSSFCRLPELDGAAGPPDALISSRSDQPWRHCGQPILFRYVTTYAFAILKLPATFAMLAPSCAASLIGQQASVVDR